MAEESETFILRLQKRWFDAVKNGDKTVEGRFYHNQYRQMKPRDRIIFIREGQEDDILEQYINARIVGIYVADSFRELHSIFGKKLLPEKYLTEEESKDPVLCMTIDDHKQAVENGTKVVGILIEIPKHLDE